MQLEHQGESDATPRSETGLWRWLNRRTGLDDLLRTALYEPIPGGARFAYIFGSGLLFIFLSQIITGVFLALYYVPSADHAHTTVAYITKAVTGGSFLRSLHAYGASAMVIVLLLHLSQTYIYGAYKGRRELLWLSGCVLFGLVMAMAFTGYLLPWDQRAYFATGVGTNAVSEVPWIGESVKRLMRGGTEMGTLTISRFFVAHVFLIPAFIFALVASHIFLFRKAGAAGPVNEDPYHPKQKAELFYPRQVLMDLSLTALLIVGLGLFCFFVPMQLGPPANPADAQYVPRPEWYYLPIFQWLKYWHGWDAIIGVLVIPTVLVLAVIALPFLDRGIERRPWKRPAAMGGYAFVVFMLLGLGLRSQYLDRHDSGVAQQLAKQRTEEEEYSRKPFEPELSSASLAAANVALADPLAAKGKTLFEGQSCNACHGDGGAGTAAAPALRKTKFSPDQLAELFKHPTAKMNAGGMPPVDLPPDDMKALIAYVESLK
ncbi:MAG TPA: cytochrome b N-terminal domain-containing protein [Candidatus Sulfotelmatobacter sp.]|jgi:ubiquinol-cytochrome c reductase cytochrome b subunit|nr:cytochrome b N-terminal domain-containing protein [Candidatus Sulfotelmatobacter sp.]